jgi:hypothetical protein
MRQNWNASRKNERRGRKMEKHTTTSGHDQVGMLLVEATLRLGEAAFNSLKQSLPLFQ